MNFTMEIHHVMGGAPVNNNPLMKDSGWSPFGPSQKYPVNPASNNKPLWKFIWGGVFLSSLMGLLSFCMGLPSGLAGGGSMLPIPQNGFKDYGKQSNHLKN
jgi:hypothetical protein